MTNPREEPATFWCHILSDQAGVNSAGDEWADWLAKEIGGYAIPTKLAGRVNLRGETIPAGRLSVCVTNSASTADGAITEDLAEKLGRSLNLVVLCSPAASRSPLVDQVVRTYKMSGRSTRLLAAIVSGVPHASGEHASQECFPAATRFNVDAEGELLNTPAEPIAADFRTADGGDGWTDPSAYLDALVDADVDSDEAEVLAKAYATRLQLMKLKVIAGVLGVSLGELTERDIAHQRELRSRNRNQTLLRAGAFVVLAAVGIWAGTLAWRSYDEAQAAKRLALRNSQVASEEAKAIEEARKATEKIRTGRLLDEAMKLLGSGDPAARTQARAKLKEAAELGFQDAQLNLARLLFQDKDDVGGAYWLRKSAAQDYSPALNVLAECLRDGINGFPKDRVEASRLFLKAANKNNGNAQANLARMAEENDPNLGGMAAALKWYEQAAANKSAFALYRLHNLYAGGGNGIKPDAAKADAYLKASADAGDPGACLELGMKLTQANSTPKDMEEGVGLLRKLANQAGTPRTTEQALIHLAILYRDGRMRIASTADGDLAEAMRILKDLAEKGSADACFHLAVTYADSRRSVADEATSLFWHRKAAELGNADSRLFMARKLLTDLKENLLLHDAARWLNEREGAPTGDGPYPNLFLDPALGHASAEKDYRDAVAWLKEARPGQRNQAAMYKVFLAELYLNKDFHRDDRFQEAFALLQEAKGMKDPLAEAMLAGIYEKGHPPQLQPDPTKAAELRRSSLATNKPGPRLYFERKDKEEQGRRTFSAEYVKALQLSATQGEAKAKTELGLHYLHFEPYQDSPLPLDFGKAAQLLAPGALNSDTLALMGLGLTYRQTKDLPNRFKLHLKAAQNGDEPLAHLWTGLALEQGMGTPIDLTEAYKWYLVAFRYGQDGSSAAKKRTESKLTAEQQVEARRRADEYKPIKTPRAAPSALPTKEGGKPNRSAKEETKPGPGGKKGNKSGTINPALAAKTVPALIEESERILSSNSANRDELEKALDCAEAAVAKSRNNTQAMDAAVRAATRLGDMELTQKWLMTIANQKLGNSTNPNLNRIAMAYLAINCERGIGTQADNVEAYKWRLLELKAMNLTTHQQLESLERKMTPGEISEARKRAKAFKPTGY